MKKLIRTITTRTKLCSRFESGAMGQRSFLVAVLPLVLAMGLMWGPFGRGHKVIMTAASSVPSAKATVEVSHDRNKNTAVEMRVRYLAHPSALTPAEEVYVVWIQASGHAPENEGELHMDSNLKGEFKTPTPYKQFSIFVTAEQSAQVRQPEGQQVLTANVVE